MATTKNVDFSGVKDGGNFNRRRIPAGDYLATITKVDDAEAKDGIFQYLVSFKIDSRPASVLPYYCKLQENQLWKLRNLLIAAGLTVPKKKIKVDPNKLLNRKVGVTIEDDDYDGKEQSSIAGVFPAAELADGAVIDDEPEDEPDEDDEEGLDDLDNEETDPLAELDRAQLKAELVKLDPSFKARKSQSDDDLRDLLRESQGASGDDDEDDEDDETPPPGPKKKAPAKPATKKARPKVDEVTDEDLEELDLDDL